MGNTCGGVAQACCSHDLNVDLNYQVEGRKDGTKISEKGNLKPLNLNEITQMSEKDPRKIQATKLINQLKSICRGHFARCQYKKIRFINIVLGKKAHQISKQELQLIPISKIKEVIIKENEFGLLKLTPQQKQTIEKSRHILQFKNGHVLTDGQLYSGQWDPKTQTKEGYGLQVWPDGSKFEGFWKNDMANGYGRFILADGDVFQGNWVDDKAHGDGNYYYAEGATYKGSWNEDKQEGRGREEWPDSSYYEGEYYRGKKHGSGIFQWADGAKYNGEWKDNKMHGSGEFKWADGRVYKGEYQNDKKHGQGIYTWPDGRMYQGQFQNGKQHGKGTYRQSNGQEVYGVWEKGKKIKIFKSLEEFEQIQSVQ